MKVAVNMRLEQSIRERAKERAAQEGRTVTNYVAWLIQQDYIKNHKIIEELTEGKTS